MASAAKTPTAPAIPLPDTFTDIYAVRLAIY
jgi:hypothetical protein